jgi:predicted protein tyrosine phosphatase
MEQSKPQNLTELPFQLAICGVDDVPEMLARFAPTHIISITDPDDEPLDFLAPINVLRLAFFDLHTMTGMVAKTLTARDRGDYPCVDHAQAILDFGRCLPGGARVLIHCHAGVSRSTAAGFLLVAAKMPGNEQVAFDLIKSIRPVAQPNRLLVRHGDQLLGAGKRMIQCADRGRP